MTSPPTARFLLREATADWHERVDGVFSKANLADRTGYGRFLSAQAAAHLPIEHALDEHGLATVITDWCDRQRAGLLRRDLLALEIPLPSLEAAPKFAGISAMLGAAYVLEGSRLGGALLKKSVPAEFPTAFLSAGSSAAWRALICLLDARLRTEQEIAAAVTAACDVFALFERSGRRFIESGPAAWQTEANRSI